MFKTLGEFFLRHLLGNVGAKVMALVMAVALWMFAYVFSYTTPKEHDVAVEVRTAGGWSVTTGVGLTTKVSMVYPRRLAETVAQEIRDRRIRVECEVPPDPSGGDAQIVSMRLKESNLVVARALGIKDVQFIPPELRFPIVREVTRPLPVLVRTSPPPPGYEIAYRPYAMPSRVEVRGRKDVVNRATGIETAEIYISDPPPGTPPEWVVQPPRAALARHVVVDGQNHPVLVEQDVQVRVDLRMLRTEKAFSGVPIRLLMRQDNPYAVSVREQSSDVRVRGPATIVDALKPENVVLYVDLTKLAPAAVNYTQPVEARVVNAPRSDDLVVTPAVTTCAVKISEPAPAKAP